MDRPVGIDTNVIVRVIVKDESQQYKASLLLVQEIETYICHTVLLETVWVLESVYKLSKANIIRSLRLVLGLPKVSSEDSQIIAQAINWYDLGLDFADALHLSKMQSYSAFYTFDKALIREARKISQIKILKPDEAEL